MTKLNPEIERYLRETAVPRLALGVGPVPIPGWLNTDYDPRVPGVFRLDAARPLPFAEASFRYVSSEHLLEHLDYPTGQAHLREVFRILQPAGRLRIATPNLVRYMELFTRTPTPLQRRYVEFQTRKFIPNAPVLSPTFVLNNLFYNWQHRFIYTPDLLEYAIRQTGFIDPVFFTPRISNDPYLTNIERHGESVGNEEATSYSTMVIEAAKPT